jgi:hypothetical protein
VRTPWIDTAAGNLTVQPAADLMLSPASNLVKLATGKSLQSDGYASQTTGMRISAAGEGDFRYLFVDEMHAKSFVADLEQALAGGQIISKSVAVLALDFALPAAGATGTLRVRDLPSAPNMAVFQSGDYIGLRQFSRASGSLTIGWAWGTVTSYADQSDGTQTWTFTRHATTPGAASGTIAADSLVLDLGVSGNGYYEVNAIDGAYGANSPYWRIVTWATHPATQTVRVQGGNLRGLFGVANEFGFYAGDGTGTGNAFVRLSSQTNEFRNLTASWYSGGSVIIQVDPTNGIGVATTPALSIQRGYAFIGESVRSGGLFARNDSAENEVLLSANIGFGSNGAWQPAIASRDALATVGAYASGSGKFARITLVARSNYGDTTMIMRSENGLMRTEFAGTVTVGDITVGGSQIAKLSGAAFTGNVSIGSNPAQSGLLRLPNNQMITARNAANSGDVQVIGINTSNQVVFGTGLNLNNQAISGVYSITQYGGADVWSLDNAGRVLATSVGYDWSALTPNSTYFENYGSGYATFGVKRFGDLVAIKGVIKAKSLLSAGTLIYTLASAYRPSATRRFAVAYNNSNDLVIWIDIESDGDIILQSTMYTNTTISMEIMYFTGG